MSQIAEELLTFGTDEHLVGILTQGVADSTGDLAMILLNAGVLHRVGPHRLHVALARHFAARGLPCLRMDISGVGDSRAPRSELTFQQLAVADVRAAMDEVTSLTGARRFALFGLCSGADNSFATALDDDRVRALVLLDPISYVTARARVRHTAKRMREAGDVRGALRWGAGRALDVLQRWAERQGDEAEADDRGEKQQGRAVPEKSEYEQQIARLLERRVDILAIFTGSLRERYNHPDQFFECFPQFRGKMECRYFPRVDHTFTELEAQRALRSTLEEWLERHPRSQRSGTPRPGQ